MINSTALFAGKLLKRMIRVDVIPWEVLFACHQIFEGRLRKDFT